MTEHAKIMLYVHKGKVVHATTDQPLPEVGEQIGFISEDGVSNWVIKATSTEHVDTIKGNIARVDLIPFFDAFQEA